MVPERFIVDGADLKNVPLRVAGYIRSYGIFSDEMFEEAEMRLKDFVSNETLWSLEYLYEDKNCSAICYCHQPELSEMLCDSFNDQGDCEHSFDLIVVTRFSQITRSKMVSDFLFEDCKISVPIYCIDTGKVITTNPEGFAYFKKHLTDLNENNSDE